MKFRLLTFALLVSGMAVTAQNPYFAPMGASESADGITVSQPRSTLAVDVTAQREQIICGPYARYAQKFLGVRAPLTDKTSWNFVSAKIALMNDKANYVAEAPAASKTESFSYAESSDEFPRLQVDRTDMSIPSLEDAARAAATQIFSLRHHRLELITGEAGENVFGEGLKAALAEIDRQEQAYLELFLGKRVLKTETHRYPVTLQADKKQYIICRFSAASGLVPDTDLSSDMVVLQIDPSGATTSSIEAAARESNVVNYRMADPATCTVIVQGKEYGRTVLPLFEFGRTIRVAVPRRR